MLFTKLYREELSYVRRVLRRLGVAERDTADLAQDLFVVVFRHLHVFDQSRSPRPWLFGIAFRLVCDYRRSSRVVREVLKDLPEIADQSFAADDLVAANEGWDQLMKMLERLEVARRSVFVLHDLNSMSGPDIAVALGIPLATVYSRVRLARADMAAAVKHVRAREGRGPSQVSPGGGAPEARPPRLRFRATRAGTSTRTPVAA